MTTLQERLRQCFQPVEDAFPQSDGSMLGLQAADALDAKDRALREIVEEWAGAECGEPVTAQEAYAIQLCKRMYQLAAGALK